MHTISKSDGVLISIRNKYKAHSMFINIILGIIYLALFAYYIMFIPPVASTTWVMEKEYIWHKIYMYINPFTVGAYILGLVVLAQYIICKNVIVRILVSLFYGMIIFFSLVVIMGMTELWELYIFIPHVIIVSMCIAIIFRERKIFQKEHSV